VEEEDVVGFVQSFERLEIGSSVGARTKELWKDTF